ncbi:MAG: isocitrate/isopropylmalate family dehydrogenase [Candidatus Micrarchaeota archaeon]
MKSYSIAVLPGDGVGPEVIREGQRAVEAVADNFSLEWVSYPYGATHYLRTGETLLDNAVLEIGALDSVYLGPLGHPRVNQGMIEKRTHQKLRNTLGQFVEVMPVRPFEGARKVFHDFGKDQVDFVIVRDSTEDFQVGIGGSFWKGTPGEMAVQAGVISRKGSQKVIEYAFRLAKKEKRKLVTSCDKADTMPHSYGLWRKVFCEVACKNKRIDSELALVSDLIPSLATEPSRYETIVAPSLFGHILFEIGAMLQGGRGMAFCADLGDERPPTFKPMIPAMGERGKTNPIGAILAGAGMLDELGERKAAARLRKAVSDVLKDGKVGTPDMGGRSSSGEVGSAILKKLVR